MNSVRKMLAQYEILPRKRLGQSFLSDMNITRKIVALAETAGDETIVEIGAGLGFMTEELVRKAGKVIALEIDPRLIAVLRDRFTGSARVEIIVGDVLKYDFSTSRPAGKIKIVGNIPTISPHRSPASNSEGRLFDGPDVPEGTGGSDYGASRDKGVRHPSVIIARHASVARSCCSVDLLLSRTQRGLGGPKVVMQDEPETEGSLFVLTVGGLRPEKKNPLNNLAAGLIRRCLPGCSEDDRRQRRAETLSVRTQR